MVSNISQRR